MASNDTKARIKAKVDHLRSDPEYHGYSVGRIRRTLVRCGLKPEDIGETDDSLAELERDCEVTSIKKLVARTRRCSGISVNAVGRIGDALSMSGLKPEDIGETDSSLAELARTYIQRWVAYRRRSPFFTPGFVKGIQEELSKNGLTLEDIGETDDSLAELAQACAASRD